MKVTGTYRFSASRERVFELLLDPAVLKACIPGCEELVPLGGGRYEAVMKVGVGAVRGTYKGQVEIADVQAPERYRMRVEGRGGPGFVKGEATIELKEATDSETEVVLVGEGQVGGMIAGLAQRLLGGVVNSIMTQFFSCMRQQLDRATDD
jgi:carbon monoxide dehydrogenase subunit G